MSKELGYVLITPYTLRKSRTGGVLGRLLSRTGLDLVAARMAFLESYRRELQTTTEQGPKWWLSEPNFLTSDARLSWRNDMLAQHPERRPSLTAEAKLQLELMTGSGRTTSGLAKLSANIDSIAPVKSPRSR